MFVALDSSWNRRRNRRFRSVSRPVPATRTRYWSCSPVAIITPCLSHFFDRREARAWFWINTESPSRRGLRSLLFASRVSQFLTSRERMAFSFAFHNSCHCSRTWLLSKIMVDFFNRGIPSRSGRPKRISAGLSEQSRSGVFLCCSNAHTTLSVFNSPFGPTLSSSSLFVALTANSARPFD